MDDQKLQIILDSLLERTQKEELNWKPTASSGKYLLALNDSSITISNHPFLVGISFEFRNEKGEIVESVEVTPKTSLHKKAVQLEDLVRRRALKSDEIIDRIIKQLKPDSITA